MKMADLQKRLEKVAKMGIGFAIKNNATDIQIIFPSTKLACVAMGILTHPDWPAPVYRDKFIIQIFFDF